MRFLLFFIFSATSFVLPFTAYAADYAWYVAKGGVRGDGPTPDAACRAYGSSATNGEYTYTLKSLTFTSSTSATCRYDLTSPIYPNYKSTADRTAYRTGDSCPPDTTYNSQTGGCETDCSATEGQLTVSLIDMGPVSSFSDPDGSAGSPVGAVCNNSCVYTAIPAPSVQCGTLVGTDQTASNVYCVFGFQGDGSSCSGEPEASNPSVDFNTPENPEDPPEPVDPNDPTEAANNCGPRHAWSGTTCTPIFNEDANPGSETDPDTGGGDSGGGSSGGDTGGGDTGGGDTGGGDTGSGDTGGGNTGGGGSGGSDDGGGSCTGDDCAQDWYQPGERTMETVMEGFTDRVQSSAVVQATDRFFTMNVGGSCPVWSVNAWVFTIVIDQHCSNNIPWSAIRAVLLACAGFVAFRWAFL